MTPRIDLNPSSADRWVTCTASPRFIMANADKLPPSDTVYNQEGTTAHEVAAALLQNREPDPKECPTPVTPEMRRHAWDYMEYVNGLGSDMLVEQMLPLWYSEGRHGKVDAAVKATGHFHIVDYKYGQGVIVDPFENLQGAIYARLCYRFISSQQHVNGSLAEAPVSIHIYQPRGRGAEDSPFHVWDTTWGEILDFTKKVTDAAELILSNGDTEFKPSEKACRFCEANLVVQGDAPGTTKMLCPALQKNVEKAIQVLPPIGKKMKFVSAEAVPVEQLIGVLEHGEAIKKWVDDLKEYALGYMKVGGTIEGFKLVLGRQGNRYWVNPEQAAQILLKDTHLREKEVYETSVISPGGAEKLLGKKALTLDLLNLINRSEGKPTIAPVGDKRPVYGGIDAAKEFAELEGGL